MRLSTSTLCSALSDGSKRARDHYIADGFCECHACLTSLSGPSNIFLQGQRPMSSNSKLAGALNLLPVSLLESAKTTICTSIENERDQTRHTLFTDESEAEYTYLYRPHTLAALGEIVFSNGFPYPRKKQPGNRRTQPFPIPPKQRSSVEYFSAKEKVRDIAKRSSPVHSADAPLD